MWKKFEVTFHFIFTSLGLLVDCKCKEQGMESWQHLVLTHFLGCRIEDDKCTGSCPATGETCTQRYDDNGIVDDFDCSSIQEHWVVNVMKWVSRGFEIVLSSYFYNDNEEWRSVWNRSYSLLAFLWHDMMWYPPYAYDILFEETQKYCNLPRMQTMQVWDETHKWPSLLHRNV